MNLSALAIVCGAGLPFVSAAAEQRGPENVLIVVNDSSPLSRTVGEYYARRRGVPVKNVCAIRTDDREEIQRTVYDREIVRPIAECLQSRELVDKILYIVTTAGLPLKIAGKGGIDGDQAAVDSELTLLYSLLQGKPERLNGVIPNPLFGKTGAQFARPQFPIYLVTRLSGYDFQDIRGLVDRAIEARNRGIVVLDLKSIFNVQGNDWLRTAASRLPKDRVLLDESRRVIEGVRDVIGFASWGSNDQSRSKRVLGFQWLPGAIMTEYVSSNGRTFTRPPDGWTLGTWKDRESHFAGSPQTLTADYIREGVTGASGHVYEPYLVYTPRPDLLFPAYLSGRNLAESFYLAMPGLSWMNIVIGDPLCRLRP